MSLNDNQFKLGSNDEETVRNLVAKLNSSYNSEVSKGPTLKIEYSSPGFGEMNSLLI